MLIFIGYQQQEADLCEDMVSCTERMFKNSLENYFFLKQGGGCLLKDGHLPGQLQVWKHMLYIYKFCYILV